MTMSWEECAAAGMTAKQAAKHRGTARSSAYKYARRSGLTFASGHEFGDYHRKVNPAEVQRLADEGYSQIVAASILGVRPERICQIAKGDGIEFMSGRMDYDTRERVAELHGRGMTDTEIASEIGCYRQIAVNFRIRLGLPVIKPPKRSKHEAAVRDMAARGMTVGEVAAALGIAASNVSNLKAKFNIPFHAGARRGRVAKC